MLFLRGIVGKRMECFRVYSSMRGLQSCLNVGKLSVRDAQQLHACQWVIGSRNLSSVHKSAEQLPLTHLLQSQSFSTLLRCGSVSPVQLSVYSLYPLFTIVRFRRRKIPKRSDTSEPSEEAEETDEEEDVDETDVSAIVFKEDSLLTSNYKEMTTHAKSARLDAVAGAGLGLPRNQVEELFLASQLRLNGERLHKKSHQLEEGDCIDYVFTGDEGSTKLKRVRVLKIEDTGRTGDKMKIYLRIWRSPQDPP